MFPCLLITHKKQIYLHRRGLSVRRGSLVVDSLMDWAERILTLIFVPATLYGGVGALARRRNDSRALRQIISEVCGGAVTAHMLTPAIQNNISADWQSVCFFLAGWGGLELMGRIYEAIAHALEERIRQKITGARRNSP